MLVIVEVDPLGLFEAPRGLIREYEEQLSKSVKRNFL